MAYSTLSDFDIFHSVPLDKPVSIAALAAKSGMPEQTLTRLLRHIIPVRVFAETSPGSGEIVHTATSAVMARNPKSQAWIAHNVDEVGRGCLRLADALRKHGDGDGDPGCSALSMEFYPDAGREQTYFGFMSTDEEENGGFDGTRTKGWRMRRFADMISGVSRDPSILATHAGRIFDWAKLGDGAVVVDVSLPHI